MHRVDDWILAFEQNRVFSFSRWGDGEMACMLGTGPANCDRHEYMENLRKGLIEAICHPTEGVVYGIQQPAIRRIFGHLALPFACLPHMQAAVPAHILHDLSRQGEIQWAADYLRRTEAVVVGPPGLRELPFVKDGSCGFVEVPEMNCYCAMPRIVSGIIRYIKHGRQVFSLSASMASEVIIDRIHRHKSYKVGEIGLIDFGAVWDPYAGLRSRTYHHERKEWKVQ